MATTDPIADPSHPRLSPSDFLAAVKHHAIIPDLPTDVADLQQRLCRCLLGAADLAEQFARGSLKGKRLAQLFPQLEQNVRALFATVKNLQRRLYKARKQVPGLPTRVGADPSGSSAVFALAALANRIVADVSKIVSGQAWAAWEERAAKDAEECDWWQDDYSDPDDDDARASADGGDLEETIDVGKLGEWLDYPAALASPVTADQLHKRFAAVTFPDPKRLFEEASFELMELDGPIAQGVSSPGESSREEQDGETADTIDGRMLRLVRDDPSRIAWSKRRMAEELCCSHSTVGESKTWRHIVACRESQRGKQSKRKSDRRRRQKPHSD